jgi:hypothetical protein
MREIKEAVESDVAGLGAIPVTVLSGFLGRIPPGIHSLLIKPTRGSIR